MYIQLLIIYNAVKKVNTNYTHSLCIAVHTHTSLNNSHYNLRPAQQRSK
uniref:Uncharacterized protein n=1 Tax=Arundo donax TaxID=35708 RepID=A0A0A9F3D8_ARUDO